jgi:DnaJ like chaperone protein
LGHIAKVDGCISEVEVKLTETYMEKMGLSAQHKIDAINLFRQGSKPDFDLQAALDSFQLLAKRESNLTEILLVYIVNLARIDGLFVETEMIVVDKVAEGLGFTSIAFEHLVRMISSQHQFTNARQHKSQSGKSQNRKAENDTKDYQHQHNDLSAAYDALGVAANASDDDIKKAYRKLMSQYHPDKLAGQGIPEFMIKAATERTQKIQGAYSYIQRYRR